MLKLLPLSRASLALVAVLSAAGSWAQQSQVLVSTRVGNRVYLDLNSPTLQETLDSLLVISGNAVDWSETLSNSTSPGVDLEFDGHALSGVSTLSADSLVVSKVIQGQIHSLANLSTDALSEGTTNLYFTAERTLSVLADTLAYLIARLDQLQSPPTATTLAVQDPTESTATLRGGASLAVSGAATTATGFVWGAAADLSDGTDVAGSALDGAFTADLTGLTAGSTYYFTAFATNLHGTAYGDTLSFSTLEPPVCAVASLVFDGHTYPTVEIGEQCWFAENLRSEHYADGSAIPSGLTNTEWKTATAGASTVYGEGGADEATNLATYGRMYNWFAVNDSRGLCPAGWHVSTSADWTALVNGLGGSSAAGNLLKSPAPAWTGSTADNSGFGGLPGGYDNGFYGLYYKLGDSGYYWTSTASSGTEAGYRRLRDADGQVYSGNYDHRFGISVRCVAD